MSGTVGPRLSTIPPTFFNDYSFEFDGVSDKLLFSSSNWGADSFSISMWINPSVLSGYRMLLGGSGYSVGTGLGHYIFGNTVKTWVSTGGSAQNLFTTSTVLSIGTWCHIVLVRNKNVSWDLYINGILTKQSYIRLTEDYTSDESLIARHYNNNSYNYGGKIDEVSIFNYGLLPTEVTDIYNLGVPTDLTSLNPLKWYRMGENAAWRDPQWLLSSNENKDKASNYSMTFDGVNDYIDCGDSNETEGITTLSISGWFKPNSGGVGGASGIVAKESRDFYVGWYSAPTNSIRFWISDDDGVTNDNVNSLTLGTNANVLNKWHHFVCTWNAVDKLKIYINGVLSNETNSVNANSALPSSTNILEIGRRVSTYFNGNIDNVSLYNSELSQSDVTNIYNGGTPTTITGAVAHYRMGEDATFDGTNWTVPDNAGSNDGTSANMDISDRVGDAPDSTNNALSLNMDEVDRETDVPT